MDARDLLKIMHVAERLKDTMRHSWTSQGRRESVAEHSWRLTVMAWFIAVPTSCVSTIQTTNTTMAIPMTAGTKMPEILSAIRSIGAFVDVASSTS